MKIYMKEPKPEESPTITLMWVGVIAALFKLIVADASIWGITFGSFSGADFALVVSPFLALYGHKRIIKNKRKSSLDSGED